MTALWATLHNALPAKSMFSHIRMFQNISCPRCNMDEETIMHCLRDCEFVKCFLKSIGFTDHTFFQKENLYGWLRHGIDGSSVFSFKASIWWIWRARNQLCMKNELISYFNLRMCIENFVHLLRKCFLKHVESPTTRMVRWNA
jgi:hypothetical protein